MITTMILLIATSLALSLAMTPLVRVAASHWNLVDLPDHNRKVHLSPIPRIGGVAIFIAYFGAVLFAQILTGTAASFTTIKAIWPAVILVFLVGVADDIVGLNAWHKLAMEIVAAVLVVCSGVYLQALPAFAVHPLIGAICTIAWLVACTNAVNLIDGLDGLASGIVFLAALAALGASLFRGDFELAFAAAPLVGALIGFLVFNFYPASIFLGDSGSLLMGFLVGCFGIVWSEKASTIPEVAAPMVALAVPLVDTTLAVIRRFLRAQPIFSPDRSHIHHRLLAHGFTHRRAVLLLYLAAGISGAFAFFLIVAGRSWEPFVIAVFASGAILGIHRLGYAELDTARDMMTRSAFRQEVNARLVVRNIEGRLAAAVTATDCWAVIRDASKEFGFHPVRMQLAGQRFAYRDESGPTSSWALHMPISQSDWIDLFHEPGPVGHRSAVVSFAEAIRKALSEKCATLTQPRAALSAAAGSYPGVSSNPSYVS